MNLFELKPHPYSQIMPPMNGGDFSELVASIKKIGRIRNAVIVYQNKILDGNHRLKACKIAKVEPRSIEFKGTDTEALDVVWDLNVNRRHLNESQRALAFAQYCKFADTGRPSQGSPGVPLSEAAEKVHVSENTMRRAKQVVQHGTKRQIQQIRKGKATVKQVATAIRSQSENGPVDVDASGITIPEPAKRYWQRRGEAQRILKLLSNLRTELKSLRPDDPMWCEVNLDGAIADIGNAYYRFRAALPSYVCPYCQGLKPIGCTACKGRGVISKYMWDMAIPEELKAMVK